MRVAILGPAPPPFGGVTRYIQNQLAWWEKEDVEAFVLPFPFPSKPESYQGAELIDYRGKSGSKARDLRTPLMAWVRAFPDRPGTMRDFARYVMGVSRFLEEQPIHVLYAHQAALPGAAAVLAGSRHGVPCVVVAYGSTWLATRGDRLRRRLQRFSVRKADWIVSPSRHCRQGAIRLGADAGRCSVVHAGIDLASYSPSVQGEEYRGRLGLGREDLVISLLGLAIRRKTETFLNAIESLTHRSDMHFLIGGGGEELDYVQHRVSQMGHNVQSLGFVPDADLPLFYAASDIHVVATNSVVECMGQSISESMATGVPVIGPNIGGIPEEIKHRENGLLFEPGNATTLAECMVELAADSSLRRRLGAAAVEMVASSFDAQRTSSEMLKILERVAGPR